jgi:hypothetical protein
MIARRGEEVRLVDWLGGLKGIFIWDTAPQNPDKKPAKRWMTCWWMMPMWNSFSCNN